MYKNKLECMKTLKEKYGENINALMQEKKSNKGYSDKCLEIIKKEYDTFFENMKNNLANELSYEQTTEDIHDFKILLDIFYARGDLLLYTYLDLFKNNEEYIKMFTKLDKNLPKYIVECMEFYINNN